RRRFLRRHAGGRHAGGRPAAAHLLRRTPPEARRRPFAGSKRRRQMTTTNSAAAGAALAVERLLERNRVSAAFFPGECERLARACKEMAERFLRGGRLLAFGRGQYATDAQHVSVEFVHPVVVGKRALPALDLSLLFRPWLEVLVQPDDMVMGFGPPEGDPEGWAALESAQTRQAMTFALPGTQGSYFVSPETDDPFVHQELIEILYHTL